MDTVPGTTLGLTPVGDLCALSPALIEACCGDLTAGDVTAGAKGDLTGDLTGDFSSANDLLSASADTILDIERFPKMEKVRGMQNI